MAVAQRRSEGGTFRRAFVHAAHLWGWPRIVAERAGSRGRRKRRGHSKNLASHHIKGQAGCGSAQAPPLLILYTPRVFSTRASSGQSGMTLSLQEGVGPGGGGRGVSVRATTLIVSFGMEMNWFLSRCQPGRAAPHPLPRHSSAALSARQISHQSAPPARNADVEPMCLILRGRVQPVSTRAP